VDGCCKEWRGRVRRVAERVGRGGRPSVPSSGPGLRWPGICGDQPAFSVRGLVKPSVLLVDKGEGVRFATRCGFILVATGVAGQAPGVDPETVCFLPEVGVEQRPSGRYCGLGCCGEEVIHVPITHHCRFLSCGVSVGLVEHPLLPCFPTSAAAALMAFSLKVFFSEKYQLLYSWSDPSHPTCWWAVAASRWKKVGYEGPSGLGSTTSALPFSSVETSVWGVL